MKRIISLWLIAINGLLCAGLATAQVASAGSGQAYPNRSIRVVLPWSAGGITDAIMRAMEQPEVKEILEANSAIPGRMSPQAFTDYLARETRGSDDGVRGSGVRFE